MAPLCPLSCLMQYLLYWWSPATRIPTTLHPGHECPSQYSKSTLTVPGSLYEDEIAYLEHPKDCHMNPHPLGARGHLTGGYMLITLWFFKQFVHTFPRGDMLITFWKCPSIHSQFPQGIHCDHFQKVATDGITKYPGGTWGIHCKRSYQSTPEPLFERTPWVLSQFHSQCGQHVSEPLIEMSFIK